MPGCREWRTLVVATAVDTMLFSYVLLCLVCAAATGVPGRRELTPFGCHGPHALVLVVSVLAYALPSLSWPARTLQMLSVATFLGDALALTWHVVGAGDAVCFVYAGIAGSLAVSSLHVYWRSYQYIQCFTRNQWSAFPRSTTRTRTPPIFG